MSVRRLAALSACLLGVACTRPAPDAPVAPPAEPGAAPAEGPAAVTLTDEKVRAYLRYQKALLIQRGLAEDVAAPDAGLRPYVPPEPRAAAKGEDAVRRVSGLSDAEIELLDRLAGALFTRRFSQSLRTTEGLAMQVELTGSQLPDEEREQFKGVIDKMRARDKELEKLPQERDRFGGANVDLALKYESELTSNWQRLSGLPSQEKMP